MVRINEPIKIRDMEVKNRFGFPPCLTNSSDAEGRPTQRTINGYEVKARGGVGIITYEAAIVDQWAKGTGNANIGSDANIPAYKKLTDIIHGYGTKIGMQINKAGMIAYTFNALGGFYLPSNIGPSSIDLVHATSAYELMFPTWWSDTVKTKNLKIKELSVKEIIAIQDLYAAGAKRAIQAGFDYVMVHSAHGTLPCSFLSPYFNKRTDKYGGSIEKRCQFIKETVGKIRESIGDIPPIMVRISADELVNDGNKIEDSMEIAKQLEKAGVDAIDVSQGIILRSPFGIVIPPYCEYGCYIHLPEAIKKVVNVPVFGVGNIIDPRMADEFIQQGKADIINMGRQLICDPDTPNKYFNGQIDDIKPCIGCLQSCGTCVYDIYSGLDYQELTPSSELKKIVVLGAGIAGMEAARVLKLRGHEVEIYEKTNKIGGLMPLLAAEYKKERFILMVDWLKTQLKKLNVPIHLNRDLTREEAEVLNPDILVLATGSKATIPVKLKDKPNVITQDESILKSKPIGKNVVIWGLNGFWKGGFETVITLGEQGYNVKALIGSNTVVGQLLIGNAGRRMYLLRYLRDNKIRVYTKAKLLDVTNNGIKFLNGHEEEQFIEADTLVYCGSRMTTGKALKEKFEGAAPEIVLIGDCVKPRDIKEAMADAQKFARSLI
jgi:2,4-dienoyl-CoA reductase-like NADH-dependent reductase (Old Yellow Enzyme family)